MDKIKNELIAVINCQLAPLKLDILEIKSQEFLAAMYDEMAAKLETTKTKQN